MFIATAVVSSLLALVLVASAGGKLAKKSPHEQRRFSPTGHAGRRSYSICRPSAACGTTPEPTAHSPTTVVWRSTRAC
jgi:hypothetical protein